MVSTSHFQRRHAGQHADSGVYRVDARSRQRAGTLPFFTSEPASAACRSGMALAMSPLNQSGVSA